MNSKISGTKFWKKQFARISQTKSFEDNIQAVGKYLIEENQKTWLTEVLRYLPEGHTFNTTVYLIAGYDNIVFKEDIALDLSFTQFHVDQRESLYYLIHELAHAGYLRYHNMPELRRMRTIGDLIEVTRFLTHLEGMGVVSAFRKRTNDNGFLDRDYQVLMSASERSKKVKEYFGILSKLERNPDAELKNQHVKTFERMSGKKTRLWYITGCYIAQQIENKCDLETLKQLVIKGADEFFKVYSEIEDLA